MKPLWLIMLVATLSVTAQSRRPETSRIEIDSDGWKLVGDLTIPAGRGMRPAVLLLHKANGTRAVYAELADRLSSMGIASLRLDLRAHGDSTNKGKFGPPFDEPMRQYLIGSDADITAAVAYLKRAKGVDPNRVGIVGASYSGEQMAISARKSAYGKAYVALSPGSFSDESVEAIDSSGSSWLFIRSADERFLKGMHEGIRNKSKRAELFEVAGDKHATDILETRSDLADMIAVWLKARL